MNYWTDLYTEIAQRITNNIPEVVWVDLWHEQIGYLASEYPFGTPAVFLSFNTVKIDDRSLLVQDVDTQMDLYIYFETFADTFMGSYNQDTALSFLELINKLYALFHGRSGVNYSTMRRVAMRRIDSGGAGVLYQLSLQFKVVDYSAQVIWGEGTFTGLETTQGVISHAKPDDKPLYQL